MSAALQVALLRARLVARTNVRRAIEILLAARVQLSAAVRFVASVIAPRAPVAA